MGNLQDKELASLARNIARDPQIPTYLNMIEMHKLFEIEMEERRRIALSLHDNKQARQ